MKSANALRREAAKARAKARRLLDYADAMDVAAEAAESKALPARNGYAKTDGMESTVTSPRHGPPSADGPVTELAAELGLPHLADVARALGVPSAHARVWNLRGRIPRKYADRIQALRDKKESKI